MNTQHGYARDKDKRKTELQPPIVLKTADHDRLLALIRQLPVSTYSRAAEFLREEVERADIATEDVSSISVVRMGSDVIFIDHGDWRIYSAKLIFPDEARGTRSNSVQGSIGSALIGLRIGLSISWTELGEERSITVLELNSDECMPSYPKTRHG